MELHVQTENAIAVKKMANVARDMATMGWKMGKRKNGTQLKELRKNKRRHNRNRNNKKQKTEQTKQEMLRTVLEACVTDKNATEISRLYASQQCSVSLSTKQL